MATQGLQFKIDSKEVEKMLNMFMSKVKNPKPLMKVVQRYVKAVTMKMFSGPRPDTSEVRGVKWPELADKTRWAKAAAKKRGKAIEITRPLVRTGAMRDSIKVLREDEQGGFVYGTTVRSKKGFLYPGIHNTGGNPNPPQRKWLFLTGLDLRQLTRFAIDHVLGKITLD